MAGSSDPPVRHILGLVAIKPRLRNPDIHRAMGPAYELATADVDLIVSAVPTPVLVADYTPIIERFQGLDHRTIRRILTEDDEVFNETLGLPRAIAANPDWARLYGSPLLPDPPDLKERHFTRAAFPDLHNTLVRQFTAPFANTTSIVSEHSAPTLLGDVVVRSHWKALIRDDVPQWDRIVIVDFDVTEMRSTQRALEELLEMKDRLVNSKDQLIASVSHEIRTPLSSIVGFAQLLHEASDLGPEDRQEMIELLVQESGDLTNIVDDLLVAAKSDLGRLEIMSVSVDLKAQGAQAVESIESGRHRIVSLPTSPVRCLGDPARVRQIVRNLISNALKYGGPEISIDGMIRDGMGALQVRDNGEGIPTDQQQRIFDAYERGDQPAGLTHSLGLGLHISRSLAHRMGGDLTYRHEDGLSVFELTLPLAGSAH